MNSPIQALVIDDDRFVRGLTERHLKTLGATTVLAASNWGEARDLLERNPACNVVVSDLDMPGATGSHFLDELSEMRPGIALIIASALNQVVLKAAERRVRKLPLRLLGVNPKPLNVDLLRSQLEPLA